MEVLKPLSNTPGTRAGPGGHNHMLAVKEVKIKKNNTFLHIPSSWVKI